MLGDINKVEKSTIENMVTNCVRESRNLDYKEHLPGGTRDDKKEFLADVSAFANAAGGDIVFGIRERRDGNKSTGIPECIVGLGNIQADSVILQLENIIRDGLEPRISGLRMRMIEGFAGGPVLIMRVPKSWSAPHMIRQGDSRFYSRNNAGKYPLDVVEIRSAFALSEALPERVRRFREERLSRIVANDLPVAMADTPKIALHILPVSALDPAVRIDLNSLEGRTAEMQPLGANGWNRRFNLDGYLSYFQNRDNEPVRSYVQVYRNGALEAIDGGTFISANPPSTNPRGSIGTMYIEKMIIDGVGNYMRLLRGIGIDPPIFVMLSLLGVKGFTLAPPNIHYFGSTYPIDRDTVVLPEKLVESFEEPPGMLMKDAFDALWQAGGYAHSHHYVDGRWAGR